MANSTADKIGLEDLIILDANDYFTVANAAMPNGDKALHIGAGTANAPYGAYLNQPLVDLHRPPATGNWSISFWIKPPSGGFATVNTNISRPTPRVLMGCSNKASFDQSNLVNNDRVNMPWWISVRESTGTSTYTFHVVEMGGGQQAGTDFTITAGGINSSGWNFVVLNRSWYNGDTRWRYDALVNAAANGTTFLSSANVAGAPANSSSTRFHIGRNPSLTSLTPATQAANGTDGFYLAKIGFRSAHFTAGECSDLIDSMFLS